MDLRRSISRFIGRFVFDRPAQKQPFARHRAALERSGQEIEARLAAITATPAHHEKLRHVVGIERWGQRRLHVFLGEPFVLDGHHPYKPDAALGWDALRQAFAEARAETIRLAAVLEQSGVDPAARVEHNDLGPLSPRGWLRYLRSHAAIETRGLR